MNGIRAKYILNILENKNVHGRNAPKPFTKMPSINLIEAISQSVRQIEVVIDTYGKDPEVYGDLWEGQMYIFAGCRRYPCNLYVQEHGLTHDEWEARLNAIGESSVTY